MSKEDDNVIDLSVRVLQDIRKELQKLNARTEHVERELGSLNKRMDGLTDTMVRGFALVGDELGELNGRFDHLLVTTGSVFRNHERRLATLEKRLGIKPVALKPVR
jgi:archaellum component FlaC